MPGASGSWDVQDPETYSTQVQSVDDMISRLRTEYATVVIGRNGTFLSRLFGLSQGDTPSGTESADIGRQIDALESVEKPAYLRGERTYENIAAQAAAIHDWMVSYDGAQQQIVHEWSFAPVVDRMVESEKQALKDVAPSIFGVSAVVLVIAAGLLFVIFYAHGRGAAA